MLRHIVLLTMDPAAPPGAVDRAVAELRRLPDLVPSVRRYSVGVDAGLAEGNATVGVVADFDDVDGYEAYRDHPEHQRVIADHLRPHLVGRTAVQHEV